MKLANSKDKEKILKAVRHKRSLNYMGRNIRLAADLSTETWQARKGWQDIQGPKLEEHAAKNTLSSKVFIQNRRRDKELPRQAGTERICDLQTSSAKNFKGNS